MRFRISFDRDSTLRALRGVVASQASLFCCSGVGVRSFTSSFNNQHLDWMELI
jgi:hypothetical protein